MAVYKSIYRFEAFDKLREGEVYILDRQDKTIYQASNLPAGKLHEIMNTANADNRYEFWVDVEWEETQE